MIAYLGAIWRCRYFWASLVKMDLRTRYRRSVLGMGWSLLHPIAMTAILCLVFAHLMNPDGGVAAYAPFLMAGLATWNFLSSSATQGCACFFQGEPYIRQHPAPLAIYPLRTVLGALIHFCMALVVVVALVQFISPTGLNVDVLWCLLPSVLILFLFTWSLATLAGFANVYFQDTQHLCEVGFQILMYTSPVIYYPRILKERGLEWLLAYNPFAAMLELIRAPLVDGKLPSEHAYLFALGTVVVVASAAVVTLARCQRRLVFYL
jgi:ABC-type polysaccharide/polyol phosphate export permease